MPNLGSTVAPAERSAQDFIDEYTNPEIVTRGGQIKRLLTEIRAQEAF